ncbi:MAG: hypothetical protein Q4B04_03080 [bacterium]|nr:hypothetical protein [bacterium]
MKFRGKIIKIVSLIIGFGGALFVLAVDVFQRIGVIEETPANYILISSIFIAFSWPFYELGNIIERRGDTKENQEKDIILRYFRNSQKRVKRKEKK